MSPLEDFSQQSSSVRITSPHSVVTQFLLDLKKTGNKFIGIQSLLDALDLWISSIKYYFDAMNPASSSLSNKMMLMWLASEEGACIFIIGSFLFGAFAYLGNGIKKEDQGECAKIADNNWPYIRDVIKRLKWTFKGTRSLLIVSQTLCQQNFISYITPLGIFLGICGATNQFWNRSMVESRKTLQETNDLFRRQVKGINACFLEVDEELIKDGDDFRKDVLMHIYAGSLIKVRGSKPYYILIDKNGNPNPFDLKNDKWTKEQQRQLQDFLKKLNRKLDEIRKDKNASSNVARVYWNDYFVELTKANENSDFYDIPDNPFHQILQNKTQFFKEKLLKSSSPAQEFLFQQAQFQDNSMAAYASATLNGILNAPYYFLGVLSMVVLPSNVFLYAVEVCCFFMGLNVLSEVYQESDYQRRLKISQLKANMVMNKRLLVTEWHHLNSNHCHLKEDISQLIKYLESNHDERVEIIRKYLVEPQFLESNDENFGFFENQPVSLEEGKISDEKLQELIDSLLRIDSIERSFDKSHQELQPLLSLPGINVWWQAIRNGLVVYGAFNSLLMTIASMSFLLCLNITPLFFYFSIVVGLLMLLLTTAYTVLFIHPQPDKNDDIEENNQNLVMKCYVSASTIKILEKPEIRASENLLIPEHAEVFRQLLSGIKKGIKSTQILFALILPKDDNVSPLAMITYLSVSISYAFFFALKGLRGLMRVDCEAYPKSFIYRLMTGCDPEANTKHKFTGSKSIQTFSCFHRPSPRNSSESNLSFDEPQTPESDRGNNGLLNIISVGKALD